LLSLCSLLLVVSPLLLAVSAHVKRLELVRHLLDGPSEISQLARDDRWVLLGSHVLSAGFYAASPEPAETVGCCSALRALRLVDEELGNFLYVEPGEPMTEPSILADVERLIEERQPSLVVFVGDRGLLKLLPNSCLRSTVGEDSGSVADYMCIVARACEGGFPR